MCVLSASHKLHTLMTQYMKITGDKLKPIHKNDACAVLRLI